MLHIPAGYTRSHTYISTCNKLSNKLACTIEHIDVHNCNNEYIKWHNV